MLCPLPVYWCLMGAAPVSVGRVLCLPFESHPEQLLFPWRRCCPKCHWYCLHWHNTSNHGHYVSKPYPIQPEWFTPSSCGSVYTCMPRTTLGNIEILWGYRELKWWCICWCVDNFLDRPDRPTLVLCWSLSTHSSRCPTSLTRRWRYTSVRWDCSYITYIWTPICVYISGLYGSDVHD